MAIGKSGTLGIDGTDCILADQWRRQPLPFGVSARGGIPIER
jgi:hypothetical protein